MADFITLPQPPEGAAGRQPALVMLSGGQDSTTALHWALQFYQPVHALIFEYGQRHAVEVAQAIRIAKLASVPHTIVTLSGLAQVSASPLVHQELDLSADPHPADELPSTFVPGRNLIFLTYAAAWAYGRQFQVLVGGMCETDFSGYPDCRRGFLDSAERTLALAMDRTYHIVTPLMYLTKAQTFLLAAELGCLEVVLEESHSCYEGNHSTRHPWGYGCGQCAACTLRRRGYEQAFPARTA